MHSPILRLVVPVLFVGLVLLPEPAAAQRWNDLEDALEGRELVLRPTLQGRRKVYLDSGDDSIFALHRGNRLFPLRESETVRITDADPEDDHIELELQSARLGRGRVDFYGPPPSADEFESWLDEVFEVTTAESDYQRYVANRQSRTLHIRGSNHLPALADRLPFSTEADAVMGGYDRCGVCFVATPDVSDYETERSLAMMSLQQVQSAFYPLVDAELQEYVAGLGEQVLANWPVPLKGYRYRFQVVDSDHINAFAVPTGYIFLTRGLLESLESENEMAAILAHEIAHVESRHSFRTWRNSRRASAIAGIVGLLAGGTDNAVDDIVAAMTAFTANLFMAGHGRDREREADLFASFYLNEADVGDQPLLSAFRKLKFARDAHDPFGEGGGLFASHPHIEERLDRASETVTASFPDEAVFQGVTDRGALVATLRFDVQRLFRNELDVVATLSTTPELGEEDDVNTIDIRVAGQRIELRERTAERIFPSDEVSAVFGSDRARRLIDGPIESVDLDLRNVDRWERVAAVAP